VDVGYENSAGTSIQIKDEPLDEEYDRASGMRLV
jgi:hypothetical protein